MRLILLFMVLVIALAACTKSLTKQELHQYVLDTENGLVQRLEKNNITLELMYKPRDIIIAQEVGGDWKGWEKVEEELDSLDYFVLKLSKNGHEIENSLSYDPEKFSQAVLYLAGGMQKDVHLEVDGQAIALEEMVYAQTFGTASGSNILMVFKSAVTKRGEDFSFVYTDTMFGTGRSQFDFSVKDIKGIPKLKHD